MSWEKVRFEELYISPSRNGIYKTADFHGNGIKIVNMGEIFAYDFIGNQEMQKIELSKEEYERFGLQNGDLLFARRSLVESGAGKSSIVVGLDEPTTFESSIIRVRLDPDKCIPLFYHYWMRSFAGRTAIGSLVTGTNVKGIRGTALKDIIVDYPDYTVQARISDILKVYDNLIENNQKQIKLLEEAAQRLYKEWFVDLRFPGYEDTPIVDGVPEGWTVSVIDEVFSIKYGKTLPTSKIASTGNYPVYGANGIIGYYGEKNCEDYSVLITSRGNGSGDVLRTYDKESFITNNSFIVRSCNSNIGFPFIHQLMLHTDFKAICTGSAQPQLTNNSISTLKVLMPCIELIVLFCSLLDAIYEKVIVLRNQIRSSIQARDRLLSKLMSGEIKV